MELPRGERVSAEEEAEATVVPVTSVIVAGIVGWPTWQQAWIAASICFVLVVGMKQMHPTRFTEVARPALQEFAILAGLYGLWRTARKLPLAQSEGAIERARRIVEFQETIGLPRELSLQRFFVDHAPLGWLSAAYYVVMHVPALFAFLGWLFWRHRSEFGRWRNVLALTTCGCLFIRFIHVAPPRFLTDLGYLDLSEVYDMSVYGPVGTGVSGQFVAMPSIHVAWAGVVGFGIVAASSSRWKWPFAVHLPLTIVVVAATGHHWWLDGIVALGLIGLSWLVDEAVRRVWRSARASAGSAPSSELGDEGGEQVVEVDEGTKLRELGDHVGG